MKFLSLLIAFLFASCSYLTLQYEPIKIEDMNKSKYLCSRLLSDDHGKSYYLFGYYNDSKLKISKVSMGYISPFLYDIMEPVLNKNQDSIKYFVLPTDILIPLVYKYKNELLYFKHDLSCRNCNDIDISRSIKSHIYFTKKDEFQSILDSNYTDLKVKDYENIECEYLKLFMFGSCDYEQAVDMFLNKLNENQIIFIDCDYLEEFNKKWYNANFEITKFNQINTILKLTKSESIDKKYIFSYNKLKCPKNNFYNINYTKSENEKSYIIRLLYKEVDGQSFELIRNDKIEIHKDNKKIPTIEPIDNICKCN